MGLGFIPVFLLCIAGILTFAGSIYTICVYLPERSRERRAAIRAACGEPSKSGPYFTKDKD